MAKNDDMQINSENLDYKKLLEDVGEALLIIKDKCRQHGIFDGMRELLNCSHCGLMEDVASDGRLMTYHDIDNPVGTGLRFDEPDEKGNSRCPGCDGVVKVGEKGFAAD